MGTLLVTTASIILVVLLVTALAYTRLQRLQGAIAALSHDLRSPLSSIQGYLETLLQKGESLDKASSQRFMNVALRSTRSA
jgi:signal transduction histidine kinase